MKNIEISIPAWLECAAQGKKIPVTIQLQGTSMEPFIRGWKDRVTIVPVTETLQIGDVVLFRRKDGSYVVHRIYRMEGDWIQTWGDNCRFPDEPVSVDAILGVACSVIRKKKIIWLNTSEQREKGIRWMRGGVRKKIWFFYCFWKCQAGRVRRKLWKRRQGISHE